MQALDTLNGQLIAKANLLQIHRELSVCSASRLLEKLDRLGVAHIVEVVLNTMLISVLKENGERVVLRALKPEAIRKVRGSPESCSSLKNVEQR